MKQTTKVFLLSKVVLILCVFIAQWIALPLFPNSYAGVDGWLNPFTAYDSEHFITISEHGYTSENLFAFFPLYPLLIFAISKIFFIPAAFAGFLISLITCFFTGYFLQKLVSNKQQKTILFLWFFSPIAAFATSVYTESLFLFLGVTFYYCLKNKKYALANVLIVLCCLTRNMGWFLFFIYLYELYKDSIPLKKMILLLFPTGLVSLAYPFYLWIIKGDFLMFSHVQSLWGREFTLPHLSLLRDVQLLQEANAPVISICINFLGIILGIILSIRFAKKYPAFIFYLLIGIIIPITMPATIDGLPSTTSLIRYIFGLFPIYLLLVELSNNKRVKIYGGTTYLLLSMFISVLFFLKRFIA